MLVTVCPNRNLFYFSFPVPELTCSVSESQTTGDIIVTWSFLHTGGLPLTALSTNYTFTKGSTVVEGGDVVNNLDRNTASVPDLVVGFVYTFTVTARNDNGSATASCGSVLHAVGKKSVRFLWTE